MNETALPTVPGRATITRADVLRAREHPLSRELSMAGWNRLPDLAKKTLAVLEAVCEGEGPVWRADLERVERHMGSLAAALDGLGVLRDAKAIECNVFIGDGYAEVVVASRRHRIGVHRHVISDVGFMRRRRESKRTPDESSPASAQPRTAPLLKLGPGGDYVREIGGAA